MAEYTKYEVFLSYPQAEVSECSDIAEAIESWGLKVFFDDKVVQAGGTWSKEADKAIRTASFAVICVGPKGIGDRQEDEVHAIYDKLKDVACDNNLIPYPLRGMDWKNLREISPYFLKIKRPATTLEHLRELLVGKKPNVVFDPIGQAPLPRSSA